MLFGNYVAKAVDSAIECLLWSETVVPGLPKQRLETERVELFVLCSELVARRRAFDCLGSENASEPRDVCLECSASGLGGLLPPHGVDQVVRGDCLVDVQEQVREDQPLLGTSNGDGAVVIGSGEWAQELETHRRTVPPRPTAGNPRGWCLPSGHG